MSEEQKQDDPEIKIIKVLDPRWIGYLAEPIKQYVEKVNIPTIRYETLYTYFVNAVQMGGTTNELWIAHIADDYKPVAFVNWYVKGLPHIGAAEIGHVYSWNRARVPVKMFLDQFLKFAYENRCSVCTGDIISEAVWKVFKRSAENLGCVINRTNLINFYGVRK